MPDSPERRDDARERAWPVLQGVLPVERARIPAEAVAGLTLAAVGIPEVLGYAKIAGMPLVTGFFGQNFGWLVGHIESPIAFVVYGIGGLVVPLVLLFLWLRLRMRTRSPAS